MTPLETRTGRQLRSLMERARENERKMRAFHDFELQVMAADSFAELFRRVLVDFRAAFSHDIVTLTLADARHEIRRALEAMNADPIPPEHLQLLFETAECQRLSALGDRPVLRAYSEALDRWLFPASDPPPRSIAMLPLERHGTVIGALALGSHDLYRFTSDIGTHFLERLATVLALCVENTLNLQRLRRDGLTDPLTGVPNRRFFDRRLVEELARAQRVGRPLAFLFVDVDRFKQVNDRHGHQAGDLILREVAQRLAAQLRTNDALARYGGEEFAVLLADTDPEEAAQVAERMRGAIAEQPFPLTDGALLAVTISIGVAAASPANGQGAEGQVQALTERADRAVLESKRDGRNRVTLAADTVSRSPA